MIRKIAVISALLATTFATTAQAQTVLYEDDFEGAVTSWSNNQTDFDPDVTRFLGRFDNNPKETSRNFILPPGTDSVEIEFDFYRFDSWDNNARWGFDRFEIDINNTEIFSLPFSSLPQADRSGTTGNVNWKHTALTGRVELAFGRGRWWFDQLFRFKIVINNPGPTLSLNLRTDLNQGGNDESGGYDNFIVTAFGTVNPELKVQKTVSTVNDTYALPGSLVEYEFDIQNTGGPVDSDSLALVDKIPDDVVLFTGDLDGAGNPVVFVDSSTPPSGVTCCVAANIQYSNSTSATPVFGYVPASNYDTDITYIRMIPTGTLRDGQTDPVNIALKFRSRIE